MTQIVENRPLPESSSLGGAQEWRGRHPAKTPVEPETASGEEILPFTAPPPLPWPRVFPGL